MKVIPAMTEFSKNQIHLVAHLVPKPGKADELAQALLAIVPDVLREPGCIFYQAHESIEQPGTIVMIEIWADQTALDAHIAGDSFSALAARFDDLLGAPLQVETLRKMG